MYRLRTLSGSYCRQSFKFKDISKKHSNRSYYLLRNAKENLQLEKHSCLFGVISNRNFLSRSKGVAQDPGLPTNARVVICGGGAIGCSIAYHLAEAGWTDVVLLEQGSLTCGTTWHSVGLIGRLRGSYAESWMCNYSSNLYKKLEAEGYPTGWKQVGSLNIARKKDRLIGYRRNLNVAEQAGVRGEILSPADVKRKAPLLNIDDIEGAMWVPEDGTVNPTDVCMALIKKAKEKGVKVVEKCKLTKVLVNDHRKVYGVETNKGLVDCEHFVNAGGMWARDIGKLSDPIVRVPLHACEHFYLVTKPMDGIEPNMPVIFDLDGRIYLKANSDRGLIGGGYEQHAKPVFHNGIPLQFEFKLLKEDWDHFQILLDQMLHRIPSLSEAEVRHLTNGPESFTPDGKQILGEAPEINNYFVASGMNSSGIASAGGVGKLMTEWIMRKAEPKINLWSMDIRRFVDMHNNKKFLRDRVTETLGVFGVVDHWEQGSTGHKTGRKLRLSPLYTRMENQAKFGQFMGYERPLYFYDTMDDSMADDHEMADDDYDDFFGAPEGKSERSAFGKPIWYDKVKSEYWACREGVCLIDMSTFTKFELKSAGDEVVDFLQYVCSNDVDKAVGTVIHTGMQNEEGGYENDCSVVRLASNHYFVISPTAQQTRSYAWIKEHLPTDGSVQLTDVTSMYTAINVIGPKAYELLGELTDASLAKQDFFSMTCKEINVGQASGVKAMRLTHSGEDGWILYIPSEYALHVYDSLMTVGKYYGVRNAGYYALRALRTEKFFAYWGTDLTPLVTPLECGREYRVKFETGKFIGYSALLRQKNEGIKQKLVQFLLEDHDLDNDPWPWGGEPILRNGKFCGFTTSTAYGFTLDRHICLGYVQNFDESNERQVIDNDFILKNAKYEIDIAGKKFAAKAGIYPPKLASAAIIINAKPKKVDRV